MSKSTETVAIFYPEYMDAHKNKMNKLLHFIGASLFFVGIAFAFITRMYWLIIVSVVVGYILPGIGHKYFEKNESFRTSKPLLCVACAAKMYFKDWINIFKRKYK